MVLRAMASGTFEPHSGKIGRPRKDTASIYKPLRNPRLGIPIAYARAIGLRPGSRVTVLYDQKHRRLAIQKGGSLKAGKLGESPTTIYISAAGFMRHFEIPEFKDAPIAVEGNTLYISLPEVQA